MLRHRLRYQNNSDHKARACIPGLWASRSCRSRIYGRLNGCFRFEGVAYSADPQMAFQPRVPQLQASLELSKGKIRILLNQEEFHSEQELSLSFDSIASLPSRIGFFSYRRPSPLAFSYMYIVTHREPYFTK
jgi:hypothetical protein